MWWSGITITARNGLFFKSMRFTNILKNYYCIILVLTVFAEIRIVGIGPMSIRPLYSLHIKRNNVETGSISLHLLIN